MSEGVTGEPSLPLSKGCQAVDIDEPTLNSATKRADGEMDSVIKGSAPTWVATTREGGYTDTKNGARSGMC